MESPKQTSNLRQKAVKGVLWSAIESWGKQVVSFGVFFLLARLLGPQAFGLVALSGIFLSFLQIFVDQGFSTAIVQRQDLETEHLDTAFWTNLGVSVVLAALSIACSGLVAVFFKEPKIVPIICWLSLNFVLNGLSSVQQAILQRSLAFKSLAIRSLIAVVVGGVVGIILAFLGFGVWSLVGQYLANSVTQVIALWWVSDWRPRFRFSQKHFKELFAFGINVTGINVLNFVNQNSDNLLIGYFLDSVALGYYSVAYRIFMIVTQLMISVIQKIAMPVFSRLQQEPEKMRKAFYNAISFTSLVAFPVFIGISILSPDLIVAIFGEKWKTSVPVLQILTLVGPLYAGFYYNGTVIMAMGKPSWNLALYCIQAIGNFTCFWIAVRWGIVAVAASYVFRAYIMSPIPIFVLKKLINIKLTTYLQQYLTPLVATLAMVAGILGIKSLFNLSIKNLFNFPDIVNSYALLALCIVGGFLIYTGTITLIAPQHLQQIRNLLSSLFPKMSLKK
ncbi:lipopolysaccharide biosynthesis protein [Nostoc sp. PCC 7107]|uniref:lipopolysaccharide biosynthesis protein n=1 Tax=Nostoc sp. PCC 7107 TaxID=317936 RepID=UPI00029F4A9F|nr:lipopolysaccharide biosynthesis protein [Nostoc sp. PCC 7107]AFY43976.1 polysaccharide biosynthesis protein [Nostoc sp. PCC 7107]